MSSRPYNPDKLPFIFTTPGIHTINQLYALTMPVGEGDTSSTRKVGKYCRGGCSNYPKFTRWVSATHRYCRTCEKAIPIKDVLENKRCPCCNRPIRFTSTWTETKRLRSLQVTK